jgi:hypothetical protein
MITLFVNTLSGNHWNKVIKHDDVSDASEALFKSDFIMMDKNQRFKMKWQWHQKIIYLKNKK